MHEDNGECVCDECHGRGVIVIDKIELYQTCKKCNGDKKFTWLEKALGKCTNYHDQNLVYNIQRMIQKLQEYGYREGYSITFDVKPMEPPNFINPIKF
jgi:DnaJ-class molecular chaperone